MNIVDAFSPVKRISPDETEAYFQNNPIESYTILDVRQPKEYEAGHIPGAILIPLPELPERYSELSKDLPVITYCRSGQRSYTAASFLKGVGFQEVYSMEGGMNAWEGIEAKGAYEAGLFLLEEITNIEELITIAWAMEDGTARFYKEALTLINQNNRQLLKVFSQLIEAEARHKERLLSAYDEISNSGINLNNELIVKYSDLMESGESVSKAIARLKNNEDTLINLLEIAMQIEVNSLDLYWKILKMSQDKAVIDIMKGLIEEEKQHLRRLGEAIEGL